jgi:hypothetical protein
MCDPSFTIFCAGMLLALLGGALIIGTPAMMTTKSRRVRAGRMRSLVIYTTYVDVGFSLAFIGVVGFVVQLFN